MEEMNRMELRGLCLRYGFHWDKIGEYIRIRSKRDTWYVKDLNHEGRLISLNHQNKYGDSRFHFHGKHKDLKNILKAIDSHDKIYQPFHRNNKLTRITNIFKLLELNN